MSKISAVINTRDAAKTLDSCLSSLKFVDEIIVVDMYSHDETVKIAHQHGAKLYFHQPLEYVEPARNFAISKAKHEWVLIVDPDEVIPPKLADKILELIEQKKPDVIGYRIPRKNMIFDAWINAAGWWPDYQLRLILAKAVKWSDKIHAQPRVKRGTVLEIPAKDTLAIHHFNYLSIDDYLSKMVRYTQIEAAQRPLPTKLDTRVIWQSFSQEFMRRLFAQKGYKANRHGLALALLQAHYELVVTLRQWEQQGFPQSKHDQTQIMSHIWQFKREINYWYCSYQLENAKGLKKWFWRVRRIIG